jgi:hypothetical protein
MQVNLKALAEGVRDVNHTVQFSLAGITKVDDGVFAAATQARDTLRTMVEGGANDAHAASLLLDDGVKLLQDLRQTRGLPNDPIVVGMVDRAKSTWAAAVSVVDNYFTTHGGAIGDVGTPRGIEMAAPRGI